MAAGIPLPSIEERATPRAREALAFAQRRHEACVQESRNAQIESAQTVGEARAEWLLEEQEEVEEIRESLRILLSETVAAFQRLSTEQRVLNTLENWRDGGTLVNVRFGRSSARDIGNAEQHQQRAYDNAVHSAHLGGTSSRQTDSGDVNSLIASLQLLVDPPARNRFVRSAW